MAQIGFKSNTGVLRDNNEDACFVIPRHNVYIVADGVGGNNAGEIASRTAVRRIAEYVVANSVDACETNEDIYQYFTACLSLVNNEIFQMGHANTETKGMATTVVIAYIRDYTAYLVNVGDSRGYHFRNGSLLQVTEDHTYVNELLKNGIITTREAETHHQRNVITRALGADAKVKADFYQRQLEKGDILMLCSDGLYGEVPEKKIVELLMRKDTMSNTCAELVEEAIACGGRDNITVVCLKI